MKTKLVTLAISTSLGVAAVPAHAGSIANSYLSITNFTLSFGDGALGGGSAINPLTDFSFLSGNNSGDVSASLSGATPSTDSANPSFDLSNPFGGSFNLSKTQGSGYASATQLTGPNAVNTFSGSTASLIGNSLVGGVSTSTVNQVSLSGSNVGTAQSNTGVNADATFQLSSDQRLQLAFNASAYLRAFVSADGNPGSNASAKYGWVFSLLNEFGDEVSRWNPNGSTVSGNNLGGTEYADAFNLTATRSASSANKNFIVDNLAGGYFEFETDLLSAGTYSLSIRQDSQADAKFIPEPTSLALAGLGLIGLGFSRRRNKNV